MSKEKGVKVMAGKKYLFLPFKPVGGEKVFEIALMKGRFTNDPKGTDFSASSDILLKDGEWGSVLMSKDTYDLLKGIFSSEDNKML